MIAQPPRRLLIPEVIQTSAMDCGPASLKAMLEGFDISISYGRLREACQTDVDGSSIDTLEEIAIQLGLEAEQVMVPTDHLLLPESESLPGIVIVRLPNGFTHFVVVWRTHGKFVQIMDPATGRQWRRRERLIEDLYVHSMPVPAEAWRSYAGGDEFLGGLRVRMRNLKIDQQTITGFIATAVSDETWFHLGALDASVRMVESIAHSGGIDRGRQTSQLVHSFFDSAYAEGMDECRTIPADYWSVRPSPADADGEAQVLLRGAVLVRVSGRRTSDSVDGAPTPLSNELLRALDEPPSRPGTQLLNFLRTDGLLTPIVLIAALALAASGLVVEALLFRGLFDIGRHLVLPEQRLLAIAVFVLVALGLLLLELPIYNGLLRVGRRLEVRLRLAFMEKIPRLGDRYFQSRPISDMAERSHSIYGLRLLPELGGQFLRIAFQFLLTIVGIIWLDPSAAVIVIVGALIVIALPLAVQPVLSEQDLRTRTHVGALGRFYLDALLGLIPIRTHGAERSVRREHESLLVEWARAGFTLQRTVVAIDAVQSIVGMGLAIWLLSDHIARTGTSGGILLLVYWTLQLPVLGQTLTLLARQYPVHRNMTLRLMEPIGELKMENGKWKMEDVEGRNVKGEGSRVKEEENGSDEVPHASLEINNAPATHHPSPATPPAIAFRSVHIVAAGHTILEDVSLEIPSGSHVAIVGQSGAGKSSFAGILLGWHRPALGEVLVDGVALDDVALELLRRRTVWVDPAVQIWNRSLFDNLCYGNGDDLVDSIGEAINRADLRGVLERLPNGLLTQLGESGGLVSGGEGQRVRFGRAILRRDADLVIFDEPFRGLDRERRRVMLARARQTWRNATLLCVTHDVAETMEFERVLVLHQGRIVEDDHPSVLAAQPDSQYRALLDADSAIREGAWSSGTWRRMRMDGGRIVEEAPVAEQPEERP